MWNSVFLDKLMLDIFQDILVNLYNQLFPKISISFFMFFGKLTLEIKVRIRIIEEYKHSNWRALGFLLIHYRFHFHPFHLLKNIYFHLKDELKFSYDHFLINLNIIDLIFDQQPSRSFGFFFIFFYEFFFSISSGLPCVRSAALYILIKVVENRFLELQEFERLATGK